MTTATIDKTGLFAHRTQRMERSVIREILKVTEQSEIISFAGGLPNPQFFPVADVAESAAKVLRDAGASALQYSTTEGYRPLREQIARRYWDQQRLAVDPDEILLTNGSQQGLDLIGKLFIDPGDVVLLERPSYLGAIQAFSAYEPEFAAVTLEDDGVAIEELAGALTARSPKLFYAVPNFQNPSGLTYSAAKREAVGRLLAGGSTMLVEDDPYGEIRFRGERLATLRHSCSNGILLGTFSKIVAPGLRIGWIVAPRPVLEQLVTAKQAADLHSNIFAQRLIHQHLLDHDLDAHLAKIRAAYGRQRDCMVDAIKRYFPTDVKCSEPDGGMFLWVRLPARVSVKELFRVALDHKVAFVPGRAFFVDTQDDRHLRLNFSNSDEGRIKEGMRRLGKAVIELQGR